MPLFFVIYSHQLLVLCMNEQNFAASFHCVLLYFFFIISPGLIRSVMFYCIAIFTFFVFMYYIFSCSIFTRFFVINSLYSVVIFTTQCNLLTSLVNTLCASHLNLCCDFIFNLLTFKSYLRFYFSLFTSIYIFFLNNYFCLLLLLLLFLFLLFRNFSKNKVIH